MKRIILLAALLLAASGCATTTNTPTNTNTPPVNANANTTASPRAEAGVTDSDITAKEKEIWDKIKSKDPEGFSSMLADDFVYVTNDGIHDKAATTDSIKGFDITDLTFSDWKIVRLDKDAALVTYTVSMKGTSGGQPIPATPVRASSVWANRGGKWVGLFHQDTEVKEPPPGGNAPAKPAAQAEAKPASSPVMPEADHAAREKQVWDAIKRKDYDAFASFLAEDQIEVSEFSVNDKAGSVEGVKQVDLSKAALSDFKTVKLNDNAVLLIYMVKGPTPPFSAGGERSSTIWVNRGGKWLAAFHQNTPVKQ